jgi:hypothetical protein
MKGSNHMKKFVLIATSAFVVSALPALAQDAVTTKPMETTTKTEAPAKERRNKANRMEKADANGDGSISKAEFLANSEKMFNEMDLNGDGNITQAEMESKRDEWRKKMKVIHDERKAKAKDQEKQQAPAPEQAPVTEQAPAPEQAPVTEQPPVTNEEAPPAAQ